MKNDSIEQEAQVLSNGELKKGRICLFRGTVIYGRQIGRTIGFPTANLAINQKNVSLARGVYGVKVTYKDEEYVGMMNVGIRPSFGDSGIEVHHEVHILDFNQFIYGELLNIEVSFFIREEKLFQNVDDLISQIHQDTETVREYFGLINKASSY